MTPEPTPEPSSVVTPIETTDGSAFLATACEIVASVSVALMVICWLVVSVVWVPGSCTTPQYHRPAVIAAAPTTPPARPATAVFRQPWPLLGLPPFSTTASAPTSATVPAVSGKVHF